MEEKENLKEEKQNREGRQGLAKSARRGKTDKSAGAQAQRNAIFGDEIALTRAGED